MPYEAGKGEHSVYRIAPDPSAQGGLEREKHYLGIEAVAWFINKESSWFSDRMASGTLDIRVANGLEKYQAALGTFELKGGSRRAPVFDNPVLPDRRYRGGPIGLAASLTAIKKDTTIASMLKSAASASLGVVAGMVQTATVAGPAQLLSAAGADLVGGVKKLLSDTNMKREPLFDFSGLEFNMQPNLLLGKEVYILFHRGAKLAEDRLSVRFDGRLVLPCFDGQPIEDGAWLLMRLRKSTEYSGVRDWFDTAREWKHKLQALVDDVQLGVVTKEEALRRLRPSTGGEETLYDDFIKLRAVIAVDGVLTELEARTYIAGLKTVLVSASQAVTQGDRGVFHETIAGVRDGLMSGASRGGGAMDAFREAFTMALPERTVSEEEEVQPAMPAFSIDDVRALPAVIEKATTLEAARKAAH